MDITFKSEAGKAQIFYVLWVLEKYSDKDHTLKQEDIVDILAKKGYKTERKSVGRDLQILCDLGYKIHGVYPDLDDDGNELPMPRGKIYLEREIGDSTLQMLINSVLFSNYIGKAEAKTLIDQLIALGSKSFAENNSAAKKMDGGKVYHQDNVDFFKEVDKINEGMAAGKKVSFRYSKYKFVGKEIVLETQKEHVVSPYYFVSKKGNYYLVGYNHTEESMWHYRMDYVKDVTILKKEYAKPVRDTLFNEMSIGDYVSKHPYMFSGEVEGIEVRIASDRLGIIVDSFGSGFTLISDDGETAVVRVYCGLMDAFHWAMQYGRYVEVVSPQSLRDQIRYHVEDMLMKYSQGDGDKYTESIRLAKRNGVLNLEGVDLTGKTKHCSLKGVRSVLLSNNNIDNVDFLKNMSTLHRLSLANNNVADLSVLKSLPCVRDISLQNLPIKDLSFLKGGRYFSLRFNLDRGVDMSALADVEHVAMLVFTEKCSFNTTIPWDVIEKKGIRYYIEDRVAAARDTSKSLGSYYPYNILLKFFSRDNCWVNDYDKLYDATEKVVKKFSSAEKRWVDYRYKGRLTSREAAEKLSLSMGEVEELEKSISKKMANPYFSKGLEDCVVPYDPARNRSIRELDVLFKKAEEKAEENKI